MAHSRRLSQLSGTKKSVVDVLLILVGSALYAFAIDAFEAPNGLAAGGVTGVATIIWALFGRIGVTVPIGIQTLVMNIFLLIPVLRVGGKRYAAKVIAGTLASSILVDVLAPVVPVMGEGDLLLCAIWGGAIAGVGLGLVFRAGGNTGGTDIIAQFVARKTALSVGTTSFIIDAIIIAASVPVFSIKNGLYAVVCMFIGTFLLDYVVDGPRRERMAYIISARYEDIEQAIMVALDRGCTRVQGSGSYSGEERPLLFCVLDRSEAAELKQMVATIDPQAIVVIGEVTEAFGYGFDPFD